MPREFFKTLFSLRDRTATLIPRGEQAVQVQAWVLLEQRFLRLEDGQELDAGTTRPSGKVRASRALLVRLLAGEVPCRLEIAGEPAIEVEVNGVSGAGGQLPEGKLNLKDVADLVDKYRSRRPASR